MLLIIFHSCVCNKIAYNFCKYPVFVSYGVEYSHYYLSLQSVMEVWKETHWREINVDQMDAELKRFAKVRGSAFAFIIINNVYVTMQLAFQKNKIKYILLISNGKFSSIIAVCSTVKQ